LYELAGRPTFVLQGDLPLFRTAEHRDEGEDIAQFQEAMTRLGFFDTDIDGEYGTVTQRAMRDFYESKGYEPWRPQGQSRYPLVQSEFVFFETLPIRVDSTSVGRGDVADGEVMAVSGARLVIDSALDLDEDDLVAVGDRVMIDHQGLGIEMTGTISAKASTPGTNELPPDQIYLEITPDEVRSELSGVNVRIVIPVEARSTEGEVLAVPAAALSATGSGDTIVTVMEDDESTRTVVVEPGLATAAGLVEVTPVEGELDESDWVVVGVERAE
jgi:peptidoglycan hydrolase-like protein with peptidoglycan-binding domain